MGYYIVYFVEYIIIKELYNIIFFISNYVFVIIIVLGDVI